MVTRVSAAALALSAKPHALYRFYDRTDALLYVGITVDLPARIKNHSRKKSWWRDVHHIAVEQHDTRQEALDAEAEAIREEGPLHNDQHNLMVQVADAPPGRCSEQDDDAIELAKQILGNLDDDDRDMVLSDERLDFDGNERSPRDRLVAAAGSAITTIMWQQSRTRTLLDDLLSFLPGEAGADYRMAVHQALRHDWGGDNYVSEMDVLIGATARHTANVATSYLARLDPDEAAEWRACASNIADLSGRWGERFAARYAVWWKADGWVPSDACHGPGRHGARCPSKIGARVWYEVCPRCDYGRRECEGHLIWCMPHMEAAAAGRLDMFDGIPFMCFAIKRFETVDPKELEPPF